MVAKHKKCNGCLENFDGPCTAIEAEAGIIIWMHSVKKHKMFQSKLLSDDDNYKSLNDLTLYGDG